jgi:hypothetical protein
MLRVGCLMGRDGRQPASTAEKRGLSGSGERMAGQLSSELGSRAQRTSWELVVIGRRVLAAVRTPSRFETTLAIAPCATIAPTIASTTATVN